MNGEVNGTMGEPMDTAPMEILKDIQHTNVTSDSDNAPDNCHNSNISDDNNHLVDDHLDTNHLETKITQDPLMINDNSSNSKDSLQDVTKVSDNKPHKENGNNSKVENDINHCDESYPDSLPNSKAKIETVDNQILNLENENKDCISEKDNSIILKEENTNEVDLDEESFEEDGLEGNNRVEDILSVNSEPESNIQDPSEKSVTKNKSNDIIVLDNEMPTNQNGDKNSRHEIHSVESDNDDCVVATEQKKEPLPVVDKPLRRSSRAIKRKRYNDDIENGGNDSDIEEIAIEDSLTRKSRPIVINDTKTLVEMAAKRRRSHQNSLQKKEPTVVIIDTNSITSNKGNSTIHGKHLNLPISTSTSAQSLYQSIVARGTTVTPIKNTSSYTSSQSQQPMILPSLTDDMFVVEAPSFIVPYVYEKPSLKPFREFVDILGKELEEERAKEEKELLEKEKEAKDKHDKEKQEKREAGEEVEESEEEVTIAKTPETEEIEDKKKKKSEKRERRKRRNEDDDVSWDGESSSDSEDEILTDEEDKTIIIKDKADSIEEISDVTDLTVDKVCSTKSDNYFDCSLGKFFINIGLNLVQEYVQNDLLKQQNRKLYREKKGGHSTKSTEMSIASLKNNLEFSKENNAPFSYKQSKCEFCSFKTESVLVMAHHLETPHMKNNVYKCNYCSFEIRSPHDILYHMEAEHNIRGRLERAPAYHQCANCPFEDNGKGKLARHLVSCAKKFKAEQNQCPPIEWEPPAKIPKISRARNNMMGTYQNAFNRSTVNSMGRSSMNVNAMSGAGTAYRPRGRSPMAVSPRGLPTPIIRGNATLRQNSPAVMGNNYPAANNGKSKSTHQPSISITPLPRQPQPVQPQQAQAKSTFVICEICDGYIKDLEQLRNHMQWIHKVKIHPKMIYNRPPLNCQKCQFRFFTDQGLERHLLGSHGLVTSSMQEAANKGKDAGRCPVCGRVYQWKLLNHVARDHNLTLKPAHLSYKCTVCTATFGMYKQFENHVYSAHSVVAKRVMDKNKTSSTPKSNDSLLKPLKINDEITIIPQPVKTAATTTKEK